MTYEDYSSLVFFRVSSHFTLSSKFLLRGDLYVSPCGTQGSTSSQWVRGWPGASDEEIGRMTDVLRTVGGSLLNTLPA
jgi:hypothetical protein